MKHFNEKLKEYGLVYNVWNPDVELEDSIKKQTMNGDIVAKLELIANSLCQIKINDKGLFSTKMGITKIGNDWEGVWERMVEIESDENLDTMIMTPSVDFRSGIETKYVLRKVLENSEEIIEKKDPAYALMKLFNKEVAQEKKINQLAAILDEVINEYCEKESMKELYSELLHSLEKDYIKKDDGVNIVKN